jgi:hypothetical protein
MAPDPLQSNLLSKLHPAVPRRWLFAIAGMLWAGVGVLLYTRAIFWLGGLALSAALSMNAVAIILAFVGYTSLFYRIVQRNIARIGTLPEHVCAFAFTAWRGYIIMGGMVVLGLTLRNSSIPKIYLSVPYGAMGGMLLIGSTRFFRRFFTSLRGQE